MEEKKLFSKGEKILLLLFGPPILVTIAMYLYGNIFDDGTTVAEAIKCVIVFFYIFVLPITLILHALTSFCIWGLLEWMERRYQEDAVKNKWKLITAPITFCVATILLEISIWFVIVKSGI